MAKKKAASQPGGTSVAKKSAPKRAAKKKSASKRGAKTPTKSTPTKSPAVSVDTILKKYQNERKTKDTLLTQSQKRIQEMEVKARQIQTELTSLKEKVKTTELDISQLDARRDEEISEALSKLGVQLPPPKLSSAPLFDHVGESEDKPSDDDSSNDE